MKRTTTSLFSHGLLGLSLLFAAAGIIAVPLCCGLSLKDTTITDNKIQASHFVLNEKMQKLQEYAK